MSLDRKLCRDHGVDFWYFTQICSSAPAVVNDYVWKFKKSKELRLVSTLIISSPSIGFGYQFIIHYKFKYSDVDFGQFDRQTGQISETHE